MTTFIDFHAIHPVAPSNLNRDENGSPKTAIVGGARRHRVSSQSWKKAMRDFFNQYNIGDNAGYRTKNVGDLLIEEIIKIDNEYNRDEAKIKAIQTLTDLKLIGSARAKKKETTTDALVLVSKNQLALIAQKIVDDAPIKEIKQAFSENSSVDLALFGRMVASDPDLNVEASSQFAHAFSTHASDPEFDFFTAVDDYSIVEHAGAGMMGDVEFVSSTLYRYATINVNHLASNLSLDKELLTEAIVAFLEAFIHTTPSGKQNSFASPTMPTAVLVSIRNDYPLSFSAAFDKPVKSTDNGYDIPSTQALVKYIQNIANVYGDVSPRYAVSIDDEITELLANIAGVISINELKEEITKAISEIEL